MAVAIALLALNQLARFDAVKPNLNRY